MATEAQLLSEIFAKIKKEHDDFREAIMILSDENDTLRDRITMLEDDVSSMKSGRSR